MPKSVLQSNWYYGEEFENVIDTDWLDGNNRTMVNAFLLLEEHGFDQDLREATATARPKI